MNWTRAENIVCEELEGGALLVNASNGGRWSLNATAAALWHLCDGRLTAKEIAQALHSRVEEISIFCEQFQARGLLTLACAAPSGTNTPSVSTLTCRSIPAFKALGLGIGPRRRPTPRGVSGPG